MFGQFLILVGYIIGYFVFGATIFAPFTTVQSVILKILMWITSFVLYNIIIVGVWTLFREK